MNAIFKSVLTVTALVVSVHAAAEVTFYEREGFQGRSFTTDKPIGSLERFGFNDRASSAIVTGERWEVCDDVRFGGKCAILRPGRYPSLSAMGMNDRISSTRDAGAPVAEAPAPAEITFYEHEDFRGRSFTTDKQIGNFERFGFNDRASSAVVTGERWEVCDDVRFGGRCRVLAPGRYPSLAAMGLNDRISSTRDAGAPVAEAGAPAQITFYENENFRGRSFTTDKQVGNFERFGFNDRASSAVVTGDRWEVCDDVRFGGNCAILRPGRYPSLSAMGMSDRISSTRDAGAPVADADAPARITFYERENFRGQSFTTDKQIGNFERAGFNDRASSVVVHSDRWEVCEDIRFGGRCMILRPGQYPSLTAMGLNNSVSSVRDVSRGARVEDNRYAPAPIAGFDGRRRDNERFYEVNVTSARAVLAANEQRCWMEKEQASKYNIPGAVIGGVLGGILGHQIGSGRGNDIATVGGVVGGAAVGANVNRGQSQDVQRCENVPGNARTDYWDVTYDFRGQQYRVQMTTQPGSTVTVNEQGEPRT